MNDDYKIGGQSDGEFNIRAIVDVLRSRWYWFALSVLVCLGMVWLYSQITVPVYKRTATVLVKEKEKAENAFIEKQLFNTVSSNLVNESLILQSRMLMTEVVKRLRLDVEYFEQDGLRELVLYPDIPLCVAFEEKVVTNYISFSVYPLSATEFRIEDFPNDREWSGVGTFGQLLDTPAGRMTITTTSCFNDEAVGQTFFVSRSSNESVAASYIGRLTVEKSAEDATMLTLSYMDNNTERADAILKTLIEVYNDDAAQDKNQILLNTAFFIDERLQIINRELGDVDGDIENYKKVNKLTNLSSEADMYLQNNNANQQEVIQFSNQLELVQFIKSYLSDPVKQSELLPANSGIMDTGIEGFINQYNENMLLRNKLMNNSSERSPAVESLNNDLAALRTSIIYSLNNLYRSLQMKRDDAQRQEELTLGRIGTVPAKERYILSVERQQKIKEELYLYLLNKREENALSMATVESKIRVIDPPFSAAVSSGMGFMVLLLAALLVGLIVPGLFFYIQPMLDVTVRGRKDLKDTLTVPFLGEIPHKKNDKDTIVVNKDERDGVSEAFRVLRSNLDYMLPKDSGTHVIMFTSANPNSGKSFLSANMAVSLAMVGKRVILLEADLRKGSGRKAGGGMYPGITNYLSGQETDWEELVDESVAYPGLHILHSGPIPPNPAELLLSPRLDELIDSLKSVYDYILIDTVPYGMMADAQIINRVASLVIYVIREGLMDRRMLPDIEALYQEKKLANLCVILNDSGAKHSGYGYYGYRYYGYRYKYGYGGKKKK